MFCANWEKVIENVANETLALAPRPSTIATQLHEKNLPNSDSELCATCQALFIRRNWTGGVHYYEKTYKHHVPAALRRSAQDGCHMCQMLWRALAREFITTAGQLKEDFIRNGDWSSKVTTYLKEDLLFRYYSNVHFESFHVELGFRMLSPGIPQEQLALTSQIPSLNTGSEASFYLVSTWLENCTESHPSCRQVHTALRLPARLVDVGEDTITLRKTPSLPRPIGYMTLSHCWGGAEFLKLTQASGFTIPGTNIPFEGLSLTFQHAIITTRRLGVRYIWIDSLCIFQDSEEDWLEESSRMGDIYAGSYCNLAAVASQDGRGGLFRKRTHSSIVPVKVDTDLPGFTDSQYYCLEKEDWESEILTCPLSRRGLVVQELLLAPRVLYFGAYQLYWECREIIASETFPQGLPSEMFDIGARNLRPLMRAGGINLNSHTCYIAWAACVESYSECDLTKGPDKLVAVSGIARTISEQPGFRDTYLAGLWKSQLRDSLLWYTDCRTPVRAASYRSPTWSWACLDGKFFLDTAPLWEICRKSSLTWLLFWMRIPRFQIRDQCSDP